MTNVRKTYKFSNETVDMLEQLVNKQSKKNKMYGLSSASERSVVETAIHYYYNSEFGKGVLDAAVDKMSQILANEMDILLRGYVDKFAIALNILNTQNEFLKLTAMIKMKSAGMVDEDLSVIEEASKRLVVLESILDETILRKFNR
jgi:hypothetical protein